MYDVRGIQSFVYDSTKLKEIVGASFMVQDALTKWLTKAIETVVPDPASRVTDWRAAGGLSIGRVPGIAVEIVYCGGGNAMVLCADSHDGRGAMALAVAIARDVSKRSLELTQGKLSIAVAHRDTDLQNFEADRDGLQRDLASVKSSKNEALPLLGVSVTAEGATDGLPAVTIHNGLGLSRAAVEKRRLFDDSGDRFGDLLPHEDGSKTVYRMQPDIDKLWQTRGENYVAVVHIDGNSTGDLIKHVMGNQRYEEAVPLMRSLSTQIDMVFGRAFRSALQELVQSVRLDEKLRNRFAITESRTSEDGTMFTLPVRMVVFAGDDVTFICNGKLALVLTQYFLESLDRESLSISVGEQQKQIHLSACAGVAIVKSHYPYRQAYELTEQLCASAKHKAKALARGEDPGSWIDFHIVYSGLTMDLEYLRQSFYDVPYLKRADSIIGPAGMAPFGQHNLLWRPLRVGSQGRTPYTWKEIDRILAEFSSWPRSRLKDLRNAMVRGFEASQLVVKEALSRGLELPAMPDPAVPTGDNALFTTENQCPYFDALELLDFYVGRTQEKGGA
jgi:hypothetical protein